MAIDIFGTLIAGAIIFVIFAMSYKKKTGKPVSELWKNMKTRDMIEKIDPEYRRYYVTKGIKQ